MSGSITLDVQFLSNEIAAGSAMSVAVSELSSKIIDMGERMDRARAREEQFRKLAAQAERISRLNRTDHIRLDGLRRHIWKEEMAKED